ncbi:hypothetical protein Bbelb_406230 [Branchiostoma belcheri]|nr:hypothetical protein Bbelb_406230 [Branchiostoma belcheri]
MPKMGKDVCCHAGRDGFADVHVNTSLRKAPVIDDQIQLSSLLTQAAANEPQPSPTLPHLRLSNRPRPHSTTPGNPAVSAQLISLPISCDVAWHQLRFLSSKSDIKKYKAEYEVEQQNILTESSLRASTVLLSLEFNKKWTQVWNTSVKETTRSINALDLESYESGQFADKKNDLFRHAGDEAVWTFPYVSLQRGDEASVPSGMDFDVQFIHVKDDVIMGSLLLSESARSVRPALSKYEKECRKVKHTALPADQPPAVVPCTTVCRPWATEMGWAPNLCSA